MGRKPARPKARASRPDPRLAEALEREAEALAQQAAAAEILELISASPADAQPVFDAIAANAVRLCDATGAAVARYDGALLHLAAHHNVQSEAVERLKRQYPRPPDPSLPMSRAVVDRVVVHVPDLQAAVEFSESVARQMGARSHVSVPLLHQGRALGAIGISRRTLRPFSDREVALLQTFAAQAVIAIENARLFREQETANRDLREALEQQTVTAEVLRLIGSSPTDAQPVFEGIARSAAKALGALGCVVFVVDGDTLRVAATHNVRPERVERLRAQFPAELRSRPEFVTTAREGVFHLADIEHNAAATPEQVEFARLGGYRTRLMVRMMRGGTVLGIIAVTREAPAAFSERQVELLKTFADQAVIAIENVRLFTQLQEKNRALGESNAQVTEALDRQTATADVLRIIARSPTDLQPVLDAIAASAVRLCAASDVVIERLEGDRFYNAAHAGSRMKGLVGLPLPLTRRFPGGRAILDRQRIIIDDMQRAAVDEYPDTLELLKLNTVGSCAEIPLLSEGKPLGNIAVLRAEVRPFTDAEVALLETFADQAVIAIENVRLFRELETRNRDLTEALQQQTATGEILRAISNSPTDVQPVFDAIARSATLLCDADFSGLHRIDGDVISLTAHHNAAPGDYENWRRVFPMRLGRDTASGRAVAAGAPVQIEDVGADPDFSRSIQALRGHRTILAVPMLKEGVALGTIVVWRREVRPFAPQQIQLLTTFADQAVIAIENVRLFNELRARTTQLTRSVEELTALGEVSRALSSTLDLETVLQTIAARASQLTGTDACSVYEYDEATEEFHWRASARLDEEVTAVARRTPIPRDEGVQGRMALARAPVQIPDIAAEGAYRGPLRDVLLRAGTRAILAVPLLRDDRLIGGLTVNRGTPGEFTPDVVELLKTFATQSALAIQNARLFREIEAKSRQLEVASRHKSDFLANVSHELRTPMNAILGFNEMILAGIYGDVPPDLQVPLNDIQASGQHLLRLINNVLDLSKIEAGRMELALADYSVPDTVEAVRASLGSLAAQKGLELVATVAADIPLARADGGRITQCLLNLAGNALKFTRQGRVEIGVEPRGDDLCYWVRDTGIGIAPDRLEAVFGEFRQGDATVAGEFGGTGLGLSITRRFVEMHGGRIWVESEPGRGSTFSFTIPLRVEQARTA